MSDRVFQRSVSVYSRALFKMGRGHVVAFPSQDDGHKVMDIQTPNASPSTQSVCSANSSGGATDVFSNSPILPVNNQ